MAPKQGDRKTKGSAEAPRSADPAEVSPASELGAAKKPSRRGGKRKEGAAPTDAADNKPRRKGRKAPVESSSVEDAPTSPVEVQGPSVSAPEPAPVAAPEPAPVAAPEPEATQDVGQQPSEAWAVAIADPVVALQPAAELPTEPAVPSAPVEANAPPDDAPAPSTTAPCAVESPIPTTQFESPAQPSSNPKAASSTSQPPTSMDRPVATLRSLEARPSSIPSHELASGLEDLPFPVAALAKQWKGATTASGRIRPLARGMTATLQLLAAATLGHLATSARRRSRLEAGMVLVARGYLNRPLSAGRWAHLAFRLAELAARFDEGVLGHVSRGLADAGGLASDVEQVLTIVGSSEQIDDELARDREVQVLDLLRALVDLCKPLRNVRMISVDARDVFSGDDEISYRVHEHRGGTSAPVPATICVPTWLERSWCYLLDGSNVEASLAPVAFGATCEPCGKPTLYLCDRIVVGPPGSAVRGHALRCGHEAVAHLPAKPLRSLAQSVSFWAP